MVYLHPCSLVARSKIVGFFNPFIIVHTQNMVLGFNLYLDSQSICVLGFGFPIMGDPMLGDPNALLFP